MEVRFIDGQGVRRCDPDDVVELFSHDDGFYWIDIPEWDDQAEALLTGLGCHALVVEGCRQRNYVPTVHGYEDQVFITAFVRCHGSIKEMERIFGVSYPTVKSRLNRIAELLDFVDTDPAPTGADVVERLRRGEISVQEALTELERSR